MAYWVDMKHPYVTYENKYIESVWWTFAQIFKTKGKNGESLVYHAKHVYYNKLSRGNRIMDETEIEQKFDTIYMAISRTFN